MGISITAVLSLAGLLVSQFLPTPVGAEQLVTIALAFGLIGGTVPGWRYRDKLKTRGLGRAAMLALAIAVAALLLYLWITTLEPGLLMTGACLISAAILGASFGGLCAIAGVTFDGP